METTDRELGDAFAVYFGRCPGKNTDEFEIPFGENLPFGAYDLNVDAVAEVAATNTIYRARLTTAEKLQVQQGP